MKKGLFCFILLCLSLLVFGGVQAYRMVMRPLTVPCINEEAFVYILCTGMQTESSNTTFQYRGLRVGFAVGDGRYVVTAAHCVADFKNTGDALFYPLIISPYYGDIFPAQIVAVDDQNDIAILKPAWDVHPALQLETGNQWKKSSKLVMAAYPPPDKERGGNGHISHSILTETAPHVHGGGELKQKIVVGPVQYPGSGWSGSPFLVPGSGKVAGLLVKKGPETKLKEWYCFGPNATDIQKLFEANSLRYEPTAISVPAVNHEKEFQKILFFFDEMTADPNQCQILIKELCTALPDSLIPHLQAGWILFDPNEYLYHTQRAIQLAPESSFAHTACGVALRRNKSYREQALTHFKRAVELDPDNLFAYSQQLKILVVTDPNAAAALGQELLARWPKEANFWFEYSRLLRNQKKYSEELPAIQKAVEWSPSGKVPFLYQRHLADSLAANNRNEDAEQAYETLLKTHQCKHCWNAYAGLLEKIHKPEQAAEIRRKAKTYPNSP